MTPEAMRRVAMERMRERARRIGVIRRTVLAGAAATFVLAWGLALNDQLAHGTKTSPGDKSTSAATGSGSGSSSTGGDDQSGYYGSEDYYGYDSGTVAPATPAPAPAPAPLTTSQS
ncbi:MAG: hypothetical protein R2718_03450 [Solirubrobacterales bacterium]